MAHSVGQAGAQDKQRHALARDNKRNKRPALARDPAAAL